MTSDAPPSAGLDNGAGSSAGDRSACYRFIASLILDDPSTALLEGLSTGELPDLVRGAEDSAGFESVARGLAEMRAFLESRASTPPAEALEELAVARTRLFRGLSGEFGPPPPYESLHRGRDGMTEGELLLEIQRFYREAGVVLPEGRVDRIDYVGLELDLMGSLCADEAMALSRGDAEAAWRLRSCQRDFLEEHLLQWVPSYCRVLARESGCGYYSGVAKLLEGFLASEAALFDIRCNE